MKFIQGSRIGFLSCFLLLALANCGGGGGGGDDSSGGGVVADFAANCLNTDSCSTNAVTSQKGYAIGNIVEVQLWLNKTGTTIGAAQLDVSFDPTVAEYQDYTEGPGLGSSPGTTYLVTPSPGEVLVSIAPPVGGKILSSKAVMVTLTFKLKKTTAGSNFSFIGPDTLDGSALYGLLPPGNIILLTPGKWTGGQFSGL